MSQTTESGRTRPASFTRPDLAHIPAYREPAKSKSVARNPPGFASVVAIPAVSLMTMLFFGLYFYSAHPAHLVPGVRRAPQDVTLPILASVLPAAAIPLPRGIPMTETAYPQRLGPALRPALHHKRPTRPSRG